MKKNVLKLLAASMFLLLLVFVSSCKKDDDEEPKISYDPVLNKTFSYIVEGNTVKFTTTIPGNVWFSSNGVDYQTVDKKVDVPIPLKGTYQFTCSTLGSGKTLTSAPFDVVIATDDLSYLETGIWKALTGGANGSKHWVLDIMTVVTTTIDNAGVSSSVSTYKSAFFHNPLDFYGDAQVGGSSTNIWGPWGGTNLYGWGGEPEVGEIIFNGVEKKATFTLDGVETTGTFNLTTYDRDPNFLTLTKDNQSLWDNMLEGKYNYLSSLSSQMGDIVFSDGLRFPMDKGRIAEGQFLPDDLKNVTIMHASDSALVIRVKRTYDGKNADGSLKESKCWLLYNYRVKEFDYGVKEAVTHPVKSAIAKADLIGTWKLGDVSGNWIGWASKDVLNAWTDGAAMNTTFEGWGQTNTAEKYAATKNVSITFKDDNTCTVHNVKYENGAEAATDYTTTYSVNNGYITFGADVVITGYTGMLELSGVNVYALDVASTTSGLWLGQNNEDKQESKAVYLLKQAKKK